MLPDDIPQVAAIENQCFTSPWDLGSFKYEVKHKEAILMVAVSSDQVIGYVCVRPILEMAHVLNLAVVPRFRQKDIGKALLDRALQELRSSRPDIGRITLEVRESNTAAIKLYENFGFKITGKRIGYYERPHENAVIMELRLPQKRDNCSGG